MVAWVPGAVSSLSERGRSLTFALSPSIILIPALHFSFLSCGWRVTHTAAGISGVEVDREAGIRLERRVKERRREAGLEAVNLCRIL